MVLFLSEETNTGPVGEMLATGRGVEIEGLIIDHLVDGKVAKRWELWDQMAMMQQFGLGFNSHLRYVERPKAEKVLGFLFLAIPSIFIIHKNP
jgi:hypothetical protein